MYFNPNFTTEKAYSQRFSSQGPLLPHHRRRASSALFNRRRRHVPQVRVCYFYNRNSLQTIQSLQPQFTSRLLIQLLPNGVHFNDTIITTGIQFKRFDDIAGAYALPTVPRLPPSSSFTLAYALRVLIMVRGLVIFVTDIVF
jgi:hypothetical protein